MPVKFATKTGKPLPTYLIGWPSGHGKNTFHLLLAGAANLKPVCFTASDGIKNLGRILHSIGTETPTLLLIDECHIIKQKKLVEPLLILLESNEYVHPNGIKVHYPNISFMLATTQPWTIPDDIRSRISAEIPMDEYSDEEIASIIRNNVADFEVPDDVINSLVPITLFTPRTARKVAESLVMRLECDEPVSPDLVCNDLGLSPTGLTNTDQQILEFLTGHYRNGPGSASSSNIASQFRVPASAVPVLMNRLVRLGYVYQDERYIWNITQVQ
jgi:Holliday junction resolvasome RuvABC ATP-dependent DNA helicase subunit